MKRWYLFLLCTSLTAIASGQLTGLSGMLKGGIATASGSGDLFRLLSGEPGMESNDRFYVVGGELTYRKNRVLFGADGSIGAQGSTYIRSVHYETFHGSATIRGGWIVKQTRRSSIYPAAGFGISTMAISKNIRSNGSNNQSQLILISPLLDIGISSDHILKSKLDKSRPLGTFLLGLRAGYRVSFRSNSWNSHHWPEPIDPPAFGSRGFYIMLAFGGGAYVWQ